MDVLTTAAVAAGLFAITDLDDLVVLVGFFASPRYRTSDIVVGQFVGMGLILAAGLLAAWAARAIPSITIGLLGLVPVALGTVALIRFIRGHTEPSAIVTLPNADYGRVLTVAAVTVSNGGDNVATYAPYLAGRSLGAVVVFGTVVFVMTGLWCVIARSAIRHRLFLPVVAKAGPVITPVVLIAIGVTVLWRGGTLASIADW